MYNNKGETILKVDLLRKGNKLWYFSSTIHFVESNSITGVLPYKF